MRGLKFVLGLVITVVVTTGCAHFSSTDHPSSSYQLAATSVARESCQVLGTVTARADCACYDKMSYDRVRGRASDNLQRQARQQYPNSDLVEVSDVVLFLNNAVAHGVAYQCVASPS